MVLIVFRKVENLDNSKPELSKNLQVQPSNSMELGTRAIHCISPNDKSIEPEVWQSGLS